MARMRSKKSDPISERARALTSEIASLEAQIRDLGVQIQASPASNATRPVEARPRPTPSPVAPEPVFEKVRAQREPARERTGEDRLRYNQLGARKFDLPAAWKRLRGRKREAVSVDPRLINYLAAGSIQGLRPLRYEKRVARNRVLALALLLLFVLWGLIAILRG